MLMALDKLCRNNWNEESHSGELKENHEILHDNESWGNRTLLNLLKVNQSVDEEDKVKERANDRNDAQNREESWIHHLKSLKDFFIRITITHFNWVDFIQ